MQPGLKILLCCHMVPSWLVCRETGMRSSSPAESSLMAILKKGSYLTIAWFLSHKLHWHIISGYFRILRGRALYKVTCDFVDAAVKGAVGVINRCIPPINPTDPECFHMWVKLKPYCLHPHDFCFSFLLSSICWHHGIPCYWSNKGACIAVIRVHMCV
jgi:hypothetical protein